MAVPLYAVFPAPYWGGVLLHRALCRNPELHSEPLAGLALHAATCNAREVTGTRRIQAGCWRRCLASRAVARARWIALIATKTDNQ